jgi:hypothetical protein
MRAVGEGRELWRGEIVLWAREPEADRVQEGRRNRIRSSSLFAGHRCPHDGRPPTGLTTVLIGLGGTSYVVM